MINATVLSTRNALLRGKLNIYNLPTFFNCYSYDYQELRRLYSPLSNSQNDEECILVMNTFERIPTISTIQLFAYRLYEAEMTAFTNIRAQKTPIMVLCPQKQRLTLKNLYAKYEGNEPFIFGDNEQLDTNSLRSINTEAPFVADKIIDYKKEIWNEALTFLRY